MSPKDFRKISHPEPKILNSLVNCTQKHTQTDRHRGGSAKTRPEVSEGGPQEKQ